MEIRLKPVDEQVIVITGASSGIGLVTAKMAAHRGARVVMTARNAHDLEQAVDEIRRAGGRAVCVVGDVSDEAHVEAIAETAIREFQGIDTWVNNAAVSIYGRVMDLSVADMRRQFDVNYWGTVYGSRAAIRRLRERGGALINVASALADRAIPLQGNYCAAKHAMKAFTDALRMELEDDGVPVSITLVKPGSIDTPLFEKAKTLLGVEPQPVPPVYAPEIAAQTIIHCAEHPVRDIIVGGMGKMLGVANLAPRVADKYMERTQFNSQMTDQPLADGRRDNLYEPVEHDGGERGRTRKGRTKGTSLYTWSALHPKVRKVATAVGAGALFAAIVRRGDSKAAETDKPPESPPA